MSFFQMASIGLSLYGKYQEKKAGDRASAFAAAIGEENAKIIERDIDIADRQIEILNRNLELSNERKGKLFKRARGVGTAIYGGSGVELSRGAPVTAELASAAEFEYELSVDAYKVETGMRANVSRMGGQAQASAYAAQGTTALLTGLGTSIGNANDYGMFTQKYWDDFNVS